MERFVDIVAPRSFPDLVLKVSAWVFLILTTALAVEYVFAWGEPENLIEFSIKCLIVAIPWTAIGFMALHHQYLLQQRLRWLANRDGLTELRNSSAFHRDARQALDKGRAAVLILLDGDHFKSINDTYGHLTGDAALIAIAGRIREVEGTSDISGRLGGEEFALLLHNGDQDRCWDIAQRLVEPIEVVHGPHSLQVSLSAGITPVTGQPLERALAEADEALYSSKRSGRARFTVFRSQSAEDISFTFAGVPAAAAS